VAAVLQNIDAPAGANVVLQLNPRWFALAGATNMSSTMKTDVAKDEIATLDFHIDPN